MLNHDRLLHMMSYALAVSAEADDPRDRGLGPIHLLKYVYLGDLANAEHSDGEPYSGATWIFFRFGPWSPEVYAEIEPVVGEIGAAERRFASGFGDDTIRWTWSEDSEEAARYLPTVVTAAIGRAVREFHNNTYPLLHHVYRTKPMLSAAPREALNLLAGQAAANDVAEPAISMDLHNVSARKLKKLRAKVQAHLASQAQAEMVASPPVVYDEDFFEIQRLLDEEPGESIEQSSGTLEFSDAVWKSAARRNFELP